MLPVDLLKLSSTEFKKFLDSFDHVFSDCDGVVWSSTPMPNTGDFFHLMKKFGKTVHFVSNNSIRNREEYQAKFAAAGYPNGYDYLITPSVAIAEYLKSINFNKQVYCVTCPETMNVLQTYGFTCKYGPDVGIDSYADYVQYLEDDENIGAVVFDSDFKVNMPKMYKASTYLRRPEVLFIDGPTDRYIPLTPGAMTLATAVFTDIVAEMSNRKPIVLGKPAKAFGEFAMKKAGVTDPSRVLFIGDMIEQDIGLGRNLGFQTLLVLTNVSIEKMNTHEIKPHYYAPSLGSIIPQLKNTLK